MIPRILSYESTKIFPSSPTQNKTVTVWMLRNNRSNIQAAYNILEYTILKTLNKYYTKQKHKIIMSICKFLWWWLNAVMGYWYCWLLWWWGRHLEVASRPHLCSPSPTLHCHPCGVSLLKAHQLNPLGFQASLNVAQKSINILEYKHKLTNILEYQKLQYICKQILA